ncbi:CYTH domain-containing protein [Thioalkalivibrio sp. XN279]|uniref:CYTH domain-containing protein n=1 Tax=Thioalkalivibrio sp. XN279 TaxID=2714953 RepID=UPI00140CC532|nr:CYTH domain-containing protein [Thioalkalivibrio sp. XN279]NHA15316.1 CYTH domain-containing protein [Thioalkalivibrio sp. XN279]
MPHEIERKFLVRDDSWRDGAEGRRMRQGYLSLDPERTVRVRISGDRAWLNVKGRTDGVRRLEFEYPIPVDDATALLALCGGAVVDKTRYLVRHGAHTWEVDEFHGDNEGLLVAEIELAHEDEPFVRPPWTGSEVSGEPRYYNASLAQHPFKAWPGA